MSMGIWLLLAGLNGAMAIAFAAWGAHGIDGQAAQWVERASQFQLIHAVALLALARPCGEGWRLVRPAAGLMVAGVVLFSGSLYLKALGIGLPIPMATPIGGISMILAWLLLGAAGWLANDHGRV
jgi:uncharacterized membrane protein YgdD (TMEM256/DUF423 family)